jgi:hypothetical protein
LFWSVGPIKFAHCNKNKMKSKKKKKAWEAPYPINAKHNRYDIFMKSKSSLRKWAPAKTNKTRVNRALTLVNLGSYEAQRMWELNSETLI